MKKCNKQIQNICAYIDGELDPSLCKEIDKHLKECRNCRIMVDTLRQTVVLCREGKTERLPAEIENQLNNVLRRKWEKKFKTKK